MPWSFKSAGTPRRSLAARIRAGAKRFRPFVERRQDGRSKAGYRIGCTLGKVVDVSTGGMRLRSTRRLTGIVKVELWATGAPRLTLRANVIWTKRMGFRRYEAGLQFLGLNPQIMAQLNTMAGGRE